MGLEHGVVQKSGAWFAYGDERLGQGRENAKQFIKDNPSVRERILADVYGKLGLGLEVDSPGDLVERDGGAALEEEERAGV